MFLNDADAAGLAEMRFGTAGSPGVIILITVGTGIGTAVFVNGQLLPNTELGHLMLEGMVAEHYCSDAVRKRGSSWGRWGKRFNKYLARPGFLFSPTSSLGGGSAKLDKFIDKIETRAPGGGREPSTRPAS